MKQKGRRVISEIEGSAGNASSTSRTDEVSLLEIIIIIVRQRRQILKATFWIGLVAAVLSVVLPVRYTATTSLLPPQQGGSAGAALMAQLGSLGSAASLAGGSLGLKNPSDLQVSLLKSRTVEDAVVDRFHLLQLYHAKRESDARKKLEKAVDLKNDAKSGLIDISVTDSNAHRAADMANGYVEEFKKFSATLAVTEASQRRLFFEEQLKQAKDNLAASEEDLKRTEQKTGVVQLDAQSRATIQLVADLRAQIASKQAEITAIRSFATGENPQLQIEEQQLAGLQAQEQKMGAASEGAENALIPKGDIPESQIEYVRKIRDVKYYETIFDLMARQYEVAKVDEARQGSEVQIVDRAIVPDRHSFPQRTLIVLGAALLGFILSVGWVLANEALNRISSDPAERKQLEILKKSLPFRRSQGTQS